MLKIGIEIEVENLNEAELTLDHITKEISEGYQKGEGYEVEGEEEEREEDA